MTLRGQIIFLTGGSEGIGRQCAQAYSAEGAIVAIAARTAERVEAAVAELGTTTSRCCVRRFPA